MIKPKTEVDRIRLSKMMLQLFEHWKLCTEDQLTLLGLAPSNTSTIRRYQDGEPMDDSEDQLARVAYLLGIHKSLRILFPNNKNELYSWIKSKNKAFQNLTPIQLVKEFGLIGLQFIQSYLDSKVLKVK